MLKTVSGGGGGSGTVTNIQTGTGLTGGPITTTGTISLANTTVTAGTYGGGTNAASIVFNAQGQATSASNVAIPQGTVTSITAGTGLSGGTITSSGTIALANTAVTAQTYGSANSVSQITVNAQGQITSATNVAIAIANSAVSGLGTMSTQNANAVAITGGNVVANVTVTNTTAASATFATSSLPLVPAGYIQIQLANATVVKVPYYAS